MQSFLASAAEAFLQRVVRVAPRRARGWLRRARYRAAVHLPRNDEGVRQRVKGGHPVLEEKAGRPVWLSVICPCRCGTELRLNLMRSQSPSWSASVDPAGRLTVSPSLDVPACGSHFWIRSGRVEWVY